MKYDLIIVAKSSDQRLIDITQRCIDSARADGADMQVIVIETHESVHEYKGADEIVKYTGKFIYNRALNLGLGYRKGDVHILANNDIVFKAGWSKIGDLMISNEFHSASALSEDHRQRHFKRGAYIYEGYTIGSLLTGWCIFVTRFCIDRIKKLDETMEFWYSDNIYADQLIAHGIRHGLFCNVQVNHVTSATLNTLSPRDRVNYSVGSLRKYKSIRMKGYAKRERSN